MTPILMRLLVRLLRLVGLPAAVPCLLRVDQSLQLTPVEEDPPTLGALVDRHAAALVLAHLSHAFGACHLHLVTVPAPVHI
jgi:hypothetical protein